MSKVLGGVSCDKADCLTALNITDWNVHKVQGDQLNMAVFFWYLVERDFFSKRYFICVHWTSHFLQGTRKNTAMFIV